MHDIIPNTLQNSSLSFWYYIRANSYAERLRLGLAVIHGEAKFADPEEEDGRNSPPPQEPERATALPGS